MALSRRELLEVLIHFSRSIDLLECALEDSTPDTERPAVVLTAAHILSVLNRHSQNALSLAEVSRWARLVQEQKDIGYGTRESAKLRSVIYQLSRADRERPHPAIRPDVNVRNS